MVARPPDPWPSRLLSYGIALAAIGVAVAVRSLVDRWLGDAVPYVTLYGAIAATAWWGGWRPAGFAALVGLYACLLLFVPPRGELGLHEPANAIGAGTYLLTCALIIGFAQTMRRAQRAAREQGEILRITLASIGDGVITTDLRGRVGYLNDVAERLTGWTRAEAAGLPLERVFTVVSEATHEPIENPALRALRKGMIVGLANHSLLIRRDGSEVAIDDTASPIRDERNQVTGCVLIFRDVAIRRQSERQSAQELAAASLLASIVTSSHDAIVSKSLDGIILSWNQGAEHLFGWPAAQAVGRHISLIIPPERLSEEDEILRRVRTGERTDHFDTVRQHRDGHRLDVSLTISPVRDAEGRIVGASKIARDISAQKAAEERIRQLMAELQEADRRKDEFLATLAHELRGPIAPLRNSLEIMKLADGDPELRRRSRATMDRQLIQMQRLIDDLLDIARITRDKLELRRQPLDLVQVIRHALESARPLAETAKVETVLDLPGRPLPLHGDPIRLSQVFGNLLSNAYRYTDPGGRVALSAWREGEWIAVSVRDDGIGIEPELLPRVFEMFTQLSSRWERAGGGLGLGLALVKRLVEMHDGSVTAYSEGPGQGSEFSVRLPALVESVALSAGATAAGLALGAARRRVLIVDDLQDSAESLAVLLRLAGHETHVAYDGAEAVEAANELRPDVVLLDLGMPQLSGLDACRQIRAQPWARDVLMIAVTGWGQDSDRQRSRDAGFDAHLVKPLDFAELEQLLDETPPSRPPR